MTIANALSWLFQEKIPTQVLRIPETILESRRFVLVAKTNFIELFILPAFAGRLLLAKKIFSS